MIQLPLSGEVLGLSPEETQRRIGACRRALGKDLLILGHHYQRDEIIRWADFRGDSLKLSQIASEHPESRSIIFCGVHFMAESADILTTDDQAVILPNLNAGCSMADMASIHQVEACWADLERVLEINRVGPITYVNSTAALKAFVGAHGGAACTSSNARRVVEWSLARFEKLLFFPDQHLGRNTAADLGFDPEKDMLVWDPHLPMGGHTPKELQQARILLWKGHCSVHARFTVDQIESARQRFSGVRVIVHPECSLEVVRAADEAGSTEKIIRAISASKQGATWAVGTEVNLVNRLAKEFPRKTIFCLDPVVCPCSTMYRIHPHYLLWAMDALMEGKVVNRIAVAPEIKAAARLALERMLAIS
ncbi:MAG TPA: quinolinate synthase NadA [Chthonomonadales bacterium]|nr:quinolinate synthase NadA [Chthonomonadales bacterium]